MGRIEFFFDTYALYEFVIGNPSYKRYFKNFEIITTKLNLIELFYKILREYDLETARFYYHSFKPFTLEFSDEIIEKAMLFRLKHKKKKLSYVDCIGYQLALANKLKFLTGDNQFKDMPSVAFVK